MHIPDGFLSTETWAAAWVISAGAVGYSVKRTSRVLKERTIPLMGVLSAFIFAAQMVNFPVMGGTSGHLLGGVLAAVLLGPYAGATALACVLTFQCLVFQDGGLTALGANIFNMAVAGTVGGYGVYRMIARTSADKRAVIVGTAVASWFSVVLASVFCALELAASKTAPVGVVLPAMAGVHALIGVGEAVITGTIVATVLKTRPDLLYKPKSSVEV